MIRHPSFLCDAHGDEDTHHAVDVHPIKPLDLGSVHDDLGHFAVALRGCLGLMPRLPTVAVCRTEAYVLSNLNNGEWRVGAATKMRAYQFRAPMPFASRCKYCAALSTAPSYHRTVRVQSGRVDTRVVVHICRNLLPRPCFPFHVGNSVVHSPPYDIVNVLFRVLHHLTTV